MKLSASVVVVCTFGLSSSAWSQEIGVTRSAAEPKAPSSSVTVGDSSEPSSPSRTPLMPTRDAIRLFQSRTEQNRRDPFSYTILGQLYLRQAREEDDFGAIGRAEEAFRSALQIQGDYAAAKVHLATAHLAKHQFAAAARSAEEVLHADPGNSMALATIGDANIELGRYDEAERSYRQLLKLAATPEVLVRVARLEELKGNVEEAIQSLGRALQLHRDSAGAVERLVWYEWRLGKALFDSGRIEQAGEHFRNALASLPDDSQSLVGLAAVSAAQGQVDQAKKLYQQAIVRRPEPPTKVALGDLFAKTGDFQHAERLYDEAEADMAREAAEPASAAAHSREVALFYCNHDRHPIKALELAKKDLEVRQDIYTYDTLAWALYKNNRFKEAAEAIGHALKLQTRDAQIAYHAGMIWKQAGDQVKARDFLHRALHINPHFSSLDPDRARQALAQLE